MIFLGGHLIDNIAEFSKRFQSILSMIPGGPEWLKWAMKDTVMPACRAGSEDQLLLLIQEGLHSDGYIRFTTFRARLSKLLTMDNEDLEQLSVVRNISFDNELSLQAILQRNNLLSYNEINKVAGFISSETITRPDLFQSPSFSDMLALTHFIMQLEVVDANLNAQASAFAQQKPVATIPEFIDMFFFYMYAAQHLVPENLSPAIQDSEVQDYYNQLQPAVNHLLFTPCAGPGHSEESIRAGLQQLAASNRFIGYNTGASAVHNLVQQINLRNQDESSVNTQIESYLSTIRSIICSVPSPAGNLSQDGKLITYRIENDQALVIVGVDEAGNIFLLPETKIKTN